MATMKQRTNKPNMEDNGFNLYFSKQKQYFLEKLTQDLQHYRSEEDDYLDADWELGVSPAQTLVERWEDIMEEPNDNLRDRIYNERILDLINVLMGIEKALEFLYQGSQFFREHHQLSVGLAMDELTSYYHEWLNSVIDIQNSSTNEQPNK